MVEGVLNYSNMFVLVPFLPKRVDLPTFCPDSKGLMLKFAYALALFLVYGFVLDLS